MCLKYVECEKNSCQKKMKKKLLYDMFKGNHKIEFKRRKVTKMNVTTKQEVVQYIISRTREIQMNSDLEPLTTNAVADAVKISRNLASFYLNELEKEKLLLKVGGRPVYFLHKQTLERRFHMELLDSAIEISRRFVESSGREKKKRKKR